MKVSQGWLAQTILASPAPTWDTVPFYDLVEVSITSTDTNDGNTLEVGDWVFVQTCDPGGSGCASVTGENMLHFFGGYVTAINHGTGRVTVENRSQSAFNTSYAALVGGRVLMGGVYHAGGYGPGRTRIRLQFYDPAEFGSVAQSAIASDDPEYIDEDYLSDLGVPQFGCDSGCTRVGQSDRTFINGIMADPDNQKLIVSVWSEDAQPAGAGNYRSAIYVFSVSHP
jgi:hypothetical protein